MNRAVVRDRAVKNCLTRQKMRRGRLPPFIAMDVIKGGRRLFRAPTALFRKAAALSTAHFRVYIGTKPRSCAAFERSIGSGITSLLLLLLLREHTPLAHNEQRGHARCPVQQANYVWFQPAPSRALTATNVAENAVVDCTDSVVKPIRTATTQCSASAMIALPPSDLRRARARRSSPRRESARRQTRAVLGRSLGRTRSLEQTIRMS